MRPRGPRRLTGSERIQILLLGLLALGHNPNSARGQERAERPSPVVGKTHIDRPCGAAVTDACLLLSYEFEAGIVGRHDIWFVDTRGRRFSYSRSDEEDVLARAQSGGTVRPTDFAALVARSHPAGATLPQNEVKRLLALVAESRATPAQKGFSGCKDGSGTRLRGYWSDPDGQASQFFTLEETHCDKVIVHNPSSAAQQLVQWVHSHAGELQDHGVETVVPWKAAINAHR
jgi:hypothetical protein